MPIAAVGAYIRRLETGEDISRPYAAVVAERERITAEHRALLAEDLRPSFDESLALARTVYPFIENHNFYIEHRYLTLFWNKVREFGALLVRPGFLADEEDVFYLRHDEVREALVELRLYWSSGGAGAPRGPRYWPPIVERRKSIYEAMREWAPPPALGRVPETITDPTAVMLWGITDERIRAWLSSLDGADDRRLTGSAGSPGVAEGMARVILRPEQLGELEQGRDPRRARRPRPSWTPVFGRIAAAVLDSGGIMCHAAIVAREYGLPSVIGTGSATKRIKTGDRLRVDADSGVVEILDLTRSPARSPAPSSPQWLLAMAAAVIGRDDELGAIQAFLAEVDQGPAALVLSGEAGIGKTTLWEVGVEAATSRYGHVLTCRGVEAEASLSFAGLSELLAHVFDDVAASLLPPRRRALEVALLLVEPGTRRRIRTRSAWRCSMCCVL